MLKDTFKPITLPLEKIVKSESKRQKIDESKEDYESSIDLSNDNISFKNDDHEAPTVSNEIPEKKHELVNINVEPETNEDQNLKF